MGQESVVYGCILGARWKVEDPRRLQRLNAAIVDGLPETDTFPFLTRAMFACAEEGFDKGVYKSVPIHFGATMKGVEWLWSEWLERFEALLARLYWTEAFLHLRTEGTVGHYDYVYSVVDRDSSFADPPRPPSIWKLTGGPRRFDADGPDHAAPVTWTHEGGVWTPA